MGIPCELCRPDLKKRRSSFKPAMGAALFEPKVLHMVNSDSGLRRLFAAIVNGDDNLVSQLLSRSPGLSVACLGAGATRKTASSFYLALIGRYLWAGDTALHIAAAAYQTKIVRKLLSAGADVHARNRLGDEPLHAAAVGQPGSRMWNARAQAQTLRRLVAAGANPNALNKTGVSPLHRTIRCRCAEAVRTLLECGADPDLRNKNGSMPILLATRNTGRGGTGLPEAKLQQKMILRLLESYVRG